MKKILTVALALLMVTGLTACGNAGNNNSSSQGSSTSANSTVDNSQSGESSESSQSGDSSEGSQSGDTAPEAAKLTAKLELISLDDRDPSVLRGVSIAGNQVGSTEFNNRKPALTPTQRAVSGYGCLNTETIRSITTPAPSPTLCPALQTTATFTIPRTRKIPPPLAGEASISIMRSRNPVTTISFSPARARQ